MSRDSKLLRIGVPSFLVLMLLGSSAYSTWRAIRAPIFNNEYAPEDFRVPLSTISSESVSREDNSLKIMSRKTYFPYLAGATRVFLPYTDYQGLVKYASLNEVDYLLLQYHNVATYPFIERFEKREVPDFELLYSAESAFGSPIELYRFRGTNR